MWNVEFYEKDNGEIPVRDFLKSLEPKMRAKAVKEIEILEELGIALREPYSKPVQDGIFELRIQFSGDIARVFYFFVIENRVILTNGFIKKTQKTPKREIEKAQAYKVDYERREKNEI